jgi:hypothetical protein
VLSMLSTRMSSLGTVPVLGPKFDAAVSPRTLLSYRADR